MTQDGKKQYERWGLDRFLCALGPDAPANAASFVDHEEPDFVMGDSLHRSLGVEVTCLHRTEAAHCGRRLRHVEGIHARVCDAVRREWTSRGLPTAQINLHFLGHEMPRKRDEAAVADAVCGALERAIPADESSVSVQREEIWEHPVLGRFLHSISMYRSSALECPYVVAPNAAFLPSLSRELLQDAIRAKNLKVPSYRRHCDTVWLLLSHNHAGLSSHFSPCNRPAPDGFDLLFDRAFLFDVIRSEIVEISKRGEHQT